MSVEEGNLKYMSESEIARETKARKAQQELGTSTVNDCKAAIRMNMMQDNEVATKDVDSTK